MHELSTTFVLGYHGCDRTVASSLIGGNTFKPSENEFDWLGHGIYFWEANPRRALHFADEQRKRGRLTTPDVVGAVINLGFCLDLTTSAGLDAVRAAHASFVMIAAAARIELPKNYLGRDLVLRNLDCAVINHLHLVRESAGSRPYDTVKGIFFEGERLYPDAGFFEKAHIQVCVRNDRCLKGVFKVPSLDLDPD